MQRIGPIFILDCSCFSETPRPYIKKRPVDSKPLTSLIYWLEDECRLADAHFVNRSLFDSTNHSKFRSPCDSCKKFHSILSYFPCLLSIVLTSRYIWSKYQSLHAQIWQKWGNISCRDGAVFVCTYFGVWIGNTESRCVDSMGFSADFVQRRSSKSVCLVWARVCVCTLRSALTRKIWKCDAKQASAKWCAYMLKLSLAPIEEWNISSTRNICLSPLHPAYRRRTDNVAWFD